VLLTVAFGRLVYYEGQVIVITNTGSADLEQSTEFCNTSLSNYDSFRASPLFDGTGLHEFCIQAHDFVADYLPNGQAEILTSNISHDKREEICNDAANWQDYQLKGNQPLRTDNSGIYLQGHGFGPTSTVEWPNGEKRTQT